MNTTMLMILFSPDTYVWALVTLMVLLSCGLRLLWRRLRRPLWRWLGLLLVGAGWYVLLYGTLVGFGRIEVRHVEYASADLPPAFDGYRIVQFSDAHVGTYTGWREDILRRAVDTINAQQADLIVFTGDLQNKVPDEIEAHRQQLSRLKAHDGIISVLGNHDYTEYSDRSSFDKTADMGRTVSAQYEMGWHLLTNSWRRIRRDSASIFIAGMENDGEGRFPQKGKIQEALEGLSRRTFVVMLEHDPTSWRRKILPHSHCQLTLSGHTHGGQLEVLGLSPAMIRYREWGGMYYAGDRAMYVSKGLGGVIPIRFGTSPEITVITLRLRK